jgi:hypothetical protein
MNPQYLLAPIVILVMGWFAFGVIYNLRRGDAVLKWMREGLPRIGERTTFRWLGTSVAELVIAKARPPIRRLETLLVFTPRDIPWMWLIAHLQGRSDTLIFRAHLQTAPRVDLELADPKSWTGPMGLSKAAERGWESRPRGDQQLMAPQGLLDLAENTLQGLSRPAEKLSPVYRRFSLRREAPHLEVHLALPDTKGEARAYFEALIALARAAGGGNP